LALAPAAAWAKDYKSNTALDGGYMWFFAFDSRTSHIQISPALCYGGTLFQIIDFSWSRNMVAELNYLYSKARGEEFYNDDRPSNLFDLSMHHLAFNPGYFFEGRRLHPYISGGLGASLLHYEDRAHQNFDETDFTVNLGGGADYTLWETGMAALDRLDLGLRVRYFYIFQDKIVNVALNGIAVNLRLVLRW